MNRSLPMLSVAARSRWLPMTASAILMIMVACVSAASLAQLKDSIYWRKHSYEVLVSSQGGILDYHGFSGQFAQKLGNRGQPFALDSQFGKLAVDILVPLLELLVIVGDVFGDGAFQFVQADPFWQAVERQVHLFGRLDPGFGYIAQDCRRCYSHFGQIAKQPRKWKFFVQGP